jgi:hypothetical protein
MNTLSRAITAQFFPNSNSYNALRKHWSDIMNSERRHRLTAAHHLLYLALIGKDWRKTFTPPSNQCKLDNGAFWGWGMFRALEAIKLKHREDQLLSPFEGLIGAQILDELRSLLPTANSYTYKSVDFAQGTFPFDAYSEKQSSNTIIQARGTSHE